MPYKAFISYSHAADGKLAPAVQRALHRIAKPWYRLRTMRVFRDQTNLATSPGLWTSIESALGEAEFFLYMASPTAARSPWVQKEVSWWLQNRSAQRLLILLTDGTIAWSDQQRDMDWAVTDALPQQLTKAFAEEPLYTDLRWARTVDQLSSRHTQFRAAILDIASTLLNRPKDELDGDDVRQYRRTRRVAWSAVAALVTLVVVATLAAYLATRQSQLATSRALGARSEAVLPTNPELALLLAQEAVRFRADEQADYALRQAFMRNPRRMIHHAPAGRTVVATFVSSDAVVAAEPGQHAVVWNPATGERLAELASEVGDQIVLSASADQSLVALQDDHTSFALYDGRTWKTAATLPGARARFSRDGRVLTATDGDRIRQWSVPSLQERMVTASLPEGYSVRDLSADGRLLLLAEDGEVSAASVVEAESGRTLAKLPQRVLRPGAGFSPDGRLVLTEPTDDTSFELWDAQTGRMVRALRSREGEDLGWTTYVTFSPDGKRFVAGNRNGVLHVWNVESGELLGTRNGHRNDISKIEFSPDARTMLSVAADGTACLWDTASMRCLVTLGGKGDDAWDVGFAPDSGRFVTTHADGTVRVWHREAWFPSVTFPADTAVVSDDGRSLLGATGTGPVRIWDTDTGTLQATLDHTPGDIESMAINLPAALVALAPTKGAVGLWSGRTGMRKLELGSASDATTALAFNAAGTQLATGGEDGQVRLWSTDDGRSINTWRASQVKVTALRIHPDGERVLVAGWDGSARLLDIKSGAVIVEAKLDEEGAVAQAVAFNAAGTRFFLTGDKFPQVWDLETRARMQTLAGHSDEVYTGAFSPDGRLMVTGSGYMYARGEPPEDGNAVRVWDATSGRALLTYQSAEQAVETVAFAKGGTQIVAGSRDGQARRYDCEVCSPLPALLALASSRTARSLSAEERTRYVPGNALLNWMLRR